MQKAGMIPWEKGVFFTGGNVDHQLGNPTAADGTFHDNPFGVCATGPIPNGGPLNATQNISMRFSVNGTDYPVRSQTWALTDLQGGAGFGHGTIKNSVGDISVSR
jgi:hypothetical protein